MSKCRMQAEAETFNGYGGRGFAGAIKESEWLSGAKLWVEITGDRSEKRTTATLRIASIEIR